MLRVADIEHLFGKEVKITCTDGEIVRGRFYGKTTEADDPDEPESIDITGWKHPITCIEMNEIANIEEA